MAFNKLSALAMVFAALMMIGVANASSLTVWSGPGCSGRVERYSPCGCSEIRLNGGYSFIYNGQTAAMYNQGGCRGVAHTRFGSSVRSCNGFGWRSMFIQC